MLSPHLAEALEGSLRVKWLARGQESLAASCIQIPRVDLARSQDAQTAGFLRPEEEATTALVLNRIKSERWGGQRVHLKEHSQAVLMHIL